VIKTLVEAGFLTPDCDDKSIEVDGDPDSMLEINRKSDGKYLLQLEPEIHTAKCANCRDSVPFNSDGQPLPHTDGRTGRSCE
jgi:hypothetical protein